MIGDRLARVRLSAGALQALVLAGLALALVSLALAVTAFQGQAQAAEDAAVTARQEARAAIAEAVRAGEQSRTRSCEFIEAFIPPTPESGPGSPYGKRIEAAARNLSRSARCP